MAEGKADDFSRWMENLPNEKQLCFLKDLVMPGSHDSGTFYLDQSSEIGPDASAGIQNLCSVFGRLAKSVVYSWSITQSLNIYQQLKAGIRYLDLRVAFRPLDNEIRIVHALYGSTISEILEEVQMFTNENPKEVVILDFNHFYNMDCEAHQRLADTLLGMFGEVMRIPGKDGLNFTLQDMWGNDEKVIIFYQNEEVVKCYPCFWSSNSITSPWANVDDRKDLLKFLDSKCLRKEQPPECFHVTQCVLTPQTSTIMQNVTEHVRSQIDSVSWIRQ
ncbi:PI-PLC X domain-containing protein 3 [Exaiptasia diaphana]|nr:PI-PLC X domain-containing protein 3 [Exaiptasia diaphana]